VSLRKPPELTPELLAAKRANARLSTGPRTPSGKQNSKLNALKHGAYAKFEKRTMLALGEDPEEFDDLKLELRTAYGPGDTLWERQIDDLARLYWRRQRLQRAQEGLMRRAMLAVEEWQHRRRLEIAGATFDASQPEALNLSMSEYADPGVRLRKTLSLLEVIREQVKQRTFRPRQASELESLYKAKTGWRQARLLALLRLSSESLGPGADRQGSESQETLYKQLGPLEPAGDPQYQELLRLLGEEIAHVQEEFEYAEKVNEEKAAIDRDAALAPVGETWNTLVRQEGTLDRSIDRKVRILLAMRRDFARAGLPAMLGELDDDGRMRLIDKILRIETPSEATASEEAQCAAPPSEPEATLAHDPSAPTRRDGRGVNAPAPVLGNEGPAGLGSLLAKEGQGVVGDCLCRDGTAATQKLNERSLNV